MSAVEAPRNLLAGRVCVITGAGRGIGRHMAEIFAREGALLALCARSVDELSDVQAALRRELDADVLVRGVDVADAGQVRSFADEVLERFGGVNVLVNNAGIQGPVGPLSDVDLESWVAAVAVNLMGVVHTIHNFVPAMRQAGGGRIINLSGGGLGGTSPASRLSAYTASKAAVLSLTETLAVELAGDGIWINAVAPGAINTRITEAVLAAGPELAGERLYANVLRQRQGGDSIEKVEEAMLFLASEQSSCLTGKLLSAKWDPISTLGQRAEALNSTSLYALRRIDGTMFFEGPSERGGDG